ncbi:MULTISPECIES: hypothetical protein [Rhodococcus]|uniref:hypothetical protein n=1 Tax=Rhodococcus sp. IEGM 1307 TaxID=3047091 RepID=UPI001F544204|nr:MULTISPECIES: hypothetical protein [Rhodococcus]MDI9978943.1 hypothetical protein [Rhodococcus sp. IEGM 1307]
MSIDSVLAAADEVHKRATRKAVLRLLSVMCAAYFMAYIDCTKRRSGQDPSVPPHSVSAPASSSSATPSSKFRAT